jgi:S-adenosylmethionine:tRNA ribosyltransferase-isomerase
MDKNELQHYDYTLPEDLIAQTPLPKRSDARLMVVERQTRSLRHRHVRELPLLLQPEDCLVVNDTKVVPARLIGKRTRTGGRWEGLFLEADPSGLWKIMCKTRGKPTSGETFAIETSEGKPSIELELIGRDEENHWIVRPLSEENLSSEQLLQKVGWVPLPPYIRSGRMVPSDRDNYQTVYARKSGAVAAPTAGLHFTKALLQEIAKIGVTLCPITLHVGPGTFRPITTADLGDHQMHSEWGAIGEEAIKKIDTCREKGGRIIAIGTTSVRLLESAADQEGKLHPFSGKTDLFIRPPYQFKIVDAMLTNFHLPRSTLLVLVRTFGGDALMQRAYAEAVQEQYRFYSYGDAMLIL